MFIKRTEDLGDSVGVKWVGTVSAVEDLGRPFPVTVVDGLSQGLGDVLTFNVGLLVWLSETSDGSMGGCELASSDTRLLFDKPRNILGFFLNFSKMVSMMSSSSTPTLRTATDLNQCQGQR